MDNFRLNVFILSRLDRGQSIPRVNLTSTILLDCDNALETPSFDKWMDNRRGHHLPPPNPSRPIILLTLSLPCHGWKWRRLKKG